MRARVRVIFAVPNQFYLKRIRLLCSLHVGRLDFSRDYQNWPKLTDGLMVRLIVIVLGPTNLLADEA